MIRLRNNGKLYYNTPRSGSGRYARDIICKYIPLIYILAIYTTVKCGLLQKNQRDSDHSEGKISEIWEIDYNNEVTDISVLPKNMRPFCVGKQIYWEKLTTRKGNKLYIFCYFFRSVGFRKFKKIKCTILISTFSVLIKLLFFF